MSCQIGGQNHCRATCFASVFLKQTFELSRLFKKDRVKTASAAKGMVEFNCLFQKDQGITASAARIPSPNLMFQPLPCLLIQSFFYGNKVLYTLDGKIQKRKRKKQVMQNKDFEDRQAQDQTRNREEQEDVQE